jgi:uncharacterized protein
VSIETPYALRALRVKVKSRSSAGDGGVAAGADAVVSAVSARGVSYTLADVVPALVEGLREAGVQAPGRRRSRQPGGPPGKRLLDTPDFPEEWKPEAIAQSDALDYYRRVEDLDWTFVSPAAFIHPG